MNAYTWYADLSRFLSTPSVRRATIGLAGASLTQNISIHALREEGDMVFQ